MHYLIFVVISPDSANAAADLYETVSQKMAPFNCDLEMAEHEINCSCVGRQAEREAEQQAQKSCGTEAEIEARFEREHSASNARRIALFRLAYAQTLTKAETSELTQLSEKFSQNWDAAHEPYKRAYHEALLHHPLKNQAETHCGKCRGSGRVKTRQNPQAEWDYWCISGGFSENFSTLVQAESEIEVESKRKTGSEYEGCLVAVRDLPAGGPLCHAIVAGGKWHQNEEMPWMPLRERANATAEWEKIYQCLIQKHHNDFIVICDAHF